MKEDLETAVNKWYQEWLFTNSADDTDFGNILFNTFPDHEFIFIPSDNKYIISN